MIKPLFMWAGGKTRLIKHYLPFLPKEVITYYEPFFGAGALCLYVVENYNPRELIINDINKDIMNIYRSIRDDIHVFLETVDMYDKNYIALPKDKRKDMFFALRHEHAYHYQGWSQTHESAVLYFLMKTGFNGIFQINKNTNGRFGTPSGLLNQRDSVYDKQNVLEWHKLLQRAVINSVDWKLIEYRDEPNTFIFFDPPYRGSFTSYGQEFSDVDQQQLLNTARQFKHASVFLSNRDIGDGFFNNVLPLNKHIIPVVYTAGRRKRTDNGYEAKAATEVLLYNQLDKTAHS